MSKAVFRLSTLSKQLCQSQPQVKYQAKHQFISLTLNRPKQLNAMTLNMINSITQHLPLFNKHQVLWIEGAGGKALCAGGDLQSVFREDASMEDKLEFFRKQFIMDYEMTRTKAVKVACWDGVVIGAGFGLTGHSPFIIATEKTKFTMPESKIGLITIENQLLSRLRNNIGYYLCLTGEMLHGEDVYISGLANYFVPSHRIEELKDEITYEFQQERENPSDVISSILERYHTPSGRKTIQNEEKINQLFGLSSEQQILSSASKSKDEFHEIVTQKMKSMNPLSLSLVFKLLTATTNISLKQSLVLQFQVLSKLLQNKDAEEGVRCMFDKYAKPQWSYSDVFEVKEQILEGYLTIDSPALVLQ